MEDLTFCWNVKTMDGILNLMLLRCKKQKAFALPSRFRVQNVTKFAVHFSIAPKDTKKNTDCAVEKKSRGPQKKRPSRKVGNRELETFR